MLIHFNPSYMALAEQVHGRRYSHCSWTITYELQNRNFKKVIMYAAIEIVENGIT